MTPPYIPDISDRLTYTVGDGEPQDVLDVLAALLVELHLAERDSLDTDTEVDSAA
jgi:hypothetical protein